MPSPSDYGVTFSGLGPFRLPGEMKRVKVAAEQAEVWRQASVARRANMKETHDNAEA